MRTVRDLKLGSYSFRASIGAVERPHYAHLVFNSARLAKRLGYDKISVIEYGVAGGKGLLALEHHASNVEKLLSIGIEVYGFDTAKGLPPPSDYRDLPYHWKQGFFAMDEKQLTSRLKKAKLVLGDIRETAKSFFARYSPAPIGAIACDVDFYSSTVPMLEVLTVEEKYLMPRIFCYFDDTVGSEVELYNDFTGERLAINEFNDVNPFIKICKPYYFSTKRAEMWHEQIWVAHLFKHTRYNSFISEENQTLTL
jgi:hypothetical protein